MSRKGSVYGDGDDLMTLSLMRLCLSPSLIPRRPSLIPSMSLIPSLTPISVIRSIRDPVAQVSDAGSDLHVQTFEGVLP